MEHVENPGEVEQWSVVVIYDSKTGAIVHKHECVTLRGGLHPSKEVLEKDALGQASQAGRATKGVSVLHVDPHSLKADTHYKVDTKKRVLVETPQRKRKA
jgi:hypothetical protein